MYFATTAYHVPALLLIIAMAAICIALFLKIKELKKNCELYRLITSASVGGYYLWADNGKISQLSPSLISMLSLYSNDSEFSVIAKLFGDKKLQILKYFEDLKDGNIEGFNFSGTVKTPNYSKEIQCAGCSIIDNKTYALKGIIIWFFDVSEYIQQIARLESQNTQLASEIKEYSQIFNTIPIPIWKRDNNLKIKFCNSIYNKFVDNEHNNINESRIPELDQSLQHLSMIAMENNRPLSMKKHLVINGERQFYSINEIAIKNNNGLLGFAYNITDQDEIEKELARHVSAHANLLESSSSAMAVYGADTKLKMYNNAFVNLWGFKIKWLDSHPTYAEILEYLREKRKLPEQADFNKFRKEQMMLFQDITKTHEDIMHLPDGKSIRTIVIPHALGGLLFAHEDVTDRFVIERSFNSLVAAQREILDNLNEAVALFGENGKISLYNPPYIKMWSAEESFLNTNPHLSEILEKTKELFDYKDNWKNYKETIITNTFGRHHSTSTEKLTNNRIINITSKQLHNGDTLVSFVDVTEFKE